MCWPGNWTGRLGMIAWSFPKAMLDPQKETEPITVENRIGTKMSRGMLPEPPADTWRNSDQEISAAAPPPTPL